MGRRLIELVSADEKLLLVGALEQQGHPDLGRDAGELGGCGHLGVEIISDLAEVIEDAQVIIEFTLPQPSMDHLRVAADKGKAMVVGTTGFTDEQKAEKKALEEAQKATDT